MRDGQGQMGDGHVEKMAGKEFKPTCQKEVSTKKRLVQNIKIGWLFVRHQKISVEERRKETLHLESRD